MHYLSLLAFSAWSKEIGDVCTQDNPCGRGIFLLFSCLKRDLENPGFLLLMTFLQLLSILELFFCFCLLVCLQNTSRKNYIILFPSVSVGLECAWQKSRNIFLVMQSTPEISIGIPYYYLCKPDRCASTENLRDGLMLFFAKFCQGFHSLWLVNTALMEESVPRR